MNLDLRREKSDFLVSEVDPISKACQDYVKVEQEIADLEALIKLKKEVQRQVNETIVTLMEERGVKSIKMSDGNSVDIKPFYTGSISEDNKEAAFEWLRKEGYDDIIKNQVVIKFGRAEDDKADKLFSDLASKGLDADRNVKVEPMTLKGFIREMIENGKDIPMDTFGVFVGHKINIKKGK